MARNQFSSLPPLASAQDWDYIMSHHMAPRLAEAQLNAQSHSRQSSSHSTVSDSSPISTTFSVRTRSSSSIASSPPHVDHHDTTTISAKKSLSALPALPDVAEDPREKESTPTRMDSSFTSLLNSPQLQSRRDSTDFTWEPVRPISVHNAPGKYWDEFYVGSEERLVVPKRKQSESPPTDLNIHIPAQPTTTTNNSTFGRIVSRMPSLSRRLSSRKTSAASASDGKVESPKLLSRAGSFRKSLTSRSQDSYTAVEPSQLAAKIETILEDNDLQASPVEIPSPNQASYFDNKPEQPVEDPIVRSVTPLLPPLLEAMKQNQEPIQSPLASPSVAPVSSFAAPTAISPNLSEMPPLSAQPSTGSFGRSRAPTLLSEASQIPPLIIAKEEQWSTQLGHADFTILPQPYCPQTCDLETINQLIKARQNATEAFAMHLQNTAVLYGDDSKVYRLVQERWAEIQAKWQEYLDDTVNRGHAQGKLPMRMTPVEPAAVVAKTPSYVAIKPTPVAITSETNAANISNSAAIDFAQRPPAVSPQTEKTVGVNVEQSLLPVVDDFKICNGVQSILGPMAVDAPQPQQAESKRGQLKRMFSLSGFRSPRPRSQ